MLHTHLSKLAKFEVNLYARAGWIALLLTVLCCSPHLFAGKLYSWKDKNGQTHYGDHVPPEYAKKEQRELNEQGRTVTVRDRAKTPEELAEAERLKKIAEQQRAELEKQAEYDRILLQTYHSEADIDALKNSKIDSVNSQILGTKAKLEQFHDYLEILNKQAADQETAGNAVEKSHIEKIAQTKSQIGQLNTMIKEYQAEIAGITKKADKEKNRYRELNSKETQPHS